MNERSFDSIHMGRSSIDVLRARDISATGIGVHVGHGFEGCGVDAGVELVIKLPGVRAFMARGVIRHMNTGGGPAGYFGVEFRDVSASQRASIEAYVSQHRRS